MTCLGHVGSLESKLKYKTETTYKSKLHENVNMI